MTPHVHQPPVLSAEVMVQFSGAVLQITVTEKNNIGVDLFLQVVPYMCVRVHVCAYACMCMHACACVYMFSCVCTNVIAILDFM